MSETLFIDALEQLKPFLNDKKVLEIVVRGNNKQIQAFQKIALDDLKNMENLPSEVKEATEKALKALNENTLLTKKNTEMLQQVANIQSLGLVLNGISLCATCAGFAIMYEKLDQMRSEINKQFNQLQHLIKQGNDVQNDYEFKQVLSEYTNMLDARKVQQPYSEEKMRQLVDDESNVLDMLIGVFQKDIVEDKDTIILSIFSLLSMLTVSLRYFDEQYFFNHHEVVGDQDIWHSSHGKWMAVYSKLLEKWFVDKLQDHGMFKIKLTVPEVDIYYTQLLDQVVELRQEVEDNQKLILAIGDQKLLNLLREENLREVKESIEAALKEALSEFDNEDCTRVIHAVMQQAAQI